MQNISGNQQSLLQHILTLTPQQFLAYEPPQRPSYEDIIKYTSLDPSRLLRFLQNEKETRTMAEYIQKSRGLNTYIRPKDRG